MTLGQELIMLMLIQKGSLIVKLSQREQTQLLLHQIERIYFLVETVIHGRCNTV